MPPGATLGYGLETSVVVPADIVTAHRPIAGETEPRGLSYLYFAVCQGDLVPFTGERSPVGIPIDCVDAGTGARVGPSRFVSGYVTLRAHPTASNDNPRLGALAVAGRLASHAACVDDAGCAAGEGCGETGECLTVVPTCTKEDVVACPSVHLSPAVDEASYQDDATAGWPRLRESTLLRLDASKISSTSAATRFARIARDGSGVATMLANLKLTDDARFHAIVAELSRVVREVQGVRVEPANTDDGQAGYRLLFDMLGGRGIPATSISEGTLVTLALITLLRGRFPPTLVLLDDVDESLHPTAQARLMAILRDLTEGDSAIQIIATSHSPYILDCVEPEAVQVFALRDDGTVAVKCLADHPEAARSRGTLTAGQLWTLDDEHHWVIDGAALVRILLFCEAEADARTARHLVDEVLRHRGAAWVRETLELDPRLVRRWVTDVGAAQARLKPNRNTQFTAFVGGAESAEYLRQSHLIVDAWAGKGCDTLYGEIDGADHFTVIAGLADAARS